MTDPECARCGRPLADGAYVCQRPCTLGLHRSLVFLASMADSAVDTIARQTRHGDPGRGGRSQPLPVDLGASDRALEVERTVVDRARWIAEQRGLDAHTLPERPGQGPFCPYCEHMSCTAIRAVRVWPRNLAPALGRAAGWLTGQLDWLRHRPEAADVYRELHTAVSRLRWLVEGPVPRWYAGQCWELVDGQRCTTDLYANPGADTVRCPECGYRHDTAYRREWLLDEARDTLAHAELAARAITALGRRVTSSAIRGYAHRDRLINHGHDAAGRPLYRVGDILDLLDEAERLETQRALARATKQARKDAAA